MHDKKERKKRYPVAKCPFCNHSIVYSSNPKDKADFEILLANDEYQGKTQLCAKCKAMLIVLDKKSLPLGFKAIPIYSSF